MTLGVDRGLKIQLTDNTLENIKLMAPLLDEASQNQVYGLMLGIISDIGKKSEQNEKKRCREI